MSPFPSRITDPDALIRALLMVPYLPGAGNWSGADCWGVNELWYANQFGLLLNDRTGIAPGADGLAEGFDDFEAHGWIEVAEPRDHDTIIMRHVAMAEIDGKPVRRVIEHGHCGIYWRGKVIHADGYLKTDEDGNEHWTGGVRVDDFDSPRIRGRVSAILRREELAQLAS